MLVLCWCKDNGPGGVATTPRGTDHEGESFMATQKSSAPHAHPPTEDQDDTVEAHYASLERPHACYEGVVYIGHLVEDPGTGEEAEVLEAVPCRRCAGSR
jgi:hypothetical protein